MIIMRWIRALRLLRYKLPMFESALKNHHERLLSIERIIIRDWRCSSCRWWDRVDEERYDIPSSASPIHHKCLHPDIGGGDNSEEPMVRYSASSYECMGTGPGFGCIRYSRIKDGTNKTNQKENA